jgi:hypothetical protein
MPARKLEDVLDTRIVMTSPLYPRSSKMYR